LKSIQQLNDDILNQDLKVFETTSIRHSENWGSSWTKWFPGNVPNVKVDYYAKNKGEVVVAVLNDLGIPVYEEKIQAQEGLNTWNYQATVSTTGKEKWQKKVKDVKLKAAKNDAIYLIPGNYTIKMTQGAVSQTIPFEVKKNERTPR